MVSSTALAFESHAAEDLIMQEGEEEEESGRGKRLGTGAAGKRKNDAGCRQEKPFHLLQLMCTVQFALASRVFCNFFHFYLGAITDKFVV